MAKKIIRLLDVTNRDGVQTSRISLAKLEKTMINRYLDRMGIWQTELGFPTTAHEINYINANLELKELDDIRRIRLSGWTRAVPQDIEKSVQNCPELKYLNISISTSNQMINGKFKGKMKWADILENVGVALDRGYDLGLSSIAVNAEDASRTEIERLIEFGHNAKDHGATRIRYCDTLGYDDPFTIYDKVYQLASEVGIDIELHCHNDLGMAVACSVTGAKACIDGGVNAYINTTINGIGERAGNADLAATILAIQKSSGFENKYKLDRRVNLEKIWMLANYAAKCFGIPIPLNQVAVGDNAFAHESGIHVDGALKDHRNYELYDHNEVGRGHIEQIETGRLITTGEYSGIKGFQNMAGRMLIRFKNDAHAREILELVRYANVHKQTPVTEGEIQFIARYPEQAKKIMTVKP